jgi:hypothetical protein
MTLLIVLPLILIVSLLTYVVNGKEKAVEGALLYLAMLGALTLFAFVFNQTDLALEMLTGMFILTVCILLTMRFSIKNTLSIVNNSIKEIKDEGLSRM